MSNTTTTIAACAADHLQQWIWGGMEGQQRNALIAQMAVVSGRSAARRVATCDCAIRTLHFPDPRRERTAAAASNVVLQRALSLYGSGELRTLRVSDQNTFYVLRAKMNEEKHRDDLTSTIGSTADPTTKVSEEVAAMDMRVLDGLKVIACDQFVHDPSAVAALVARHAATVTALDCGMPYLARAKHEVLPGSIDEAISKCLRLESLSHVNYFAPAAYLGLSHLHTLRGVNLYIVSAATLAAALPRLRTLGVVFYGWALLDEAFFEELAPRLSSFSYTSTYAVTTEQGASPPLLPCLDELRWDNATHDWPVGRAFFGARPVLLHIPAMYWLGVPRPRDFLCRLRDLKFSAMKVLPAAVMEDLLIAAPQLRSFSALYLENDFLWSTCAAVVEALASKQIQHARLRHFTLRAAQLPTGSTFTRLKQERFPRLQRLMVNGETVDGDLDQ